MTERSDTTNSRSSDESHVSVACSSAAFLVTNITSQAVIQKGGFLDEKK
jgi:hypothetical protein